MVPHEKRDQHLHINLGGLNQAVEKVVVHLTRRGAPPVKPEVVIARQYETNPMYGDLYKSVVRITDIMSQINWDPALFADHSEMDIALERFGGQLKIIDKEKGRAEAQKMLIAALHKLRGTQYFANLPDGELKQEQVRMTLNKHFADTFDSPQAQSLRPSRL